MTSCTELSAFNGMVKDLQTMLKKENKALTAGGAEHTRNKHALAVLSTYKKHADNKTALFAVGASEQSATEKTDALTVMATKVLGPSFDVTFKGQNTPKTAVLEEAVPTALGLDLYFTVNGDLKRFSFPKNTRGKSSTRKDGGPVYVEKIRELSDLYYLGQISSKEVPALGSNNDQLLLEEEYRVSDYSHGNIQDMQAMLEKVHVAGGRKAKKEDMEVYYDILNNVSPKFFTDLDLYVNTEAEKSEGVARADRIDLTVGRAPKEFVTQQTEASVYMEEVVHSMTAAAIASDSQRATRLKRTLARGIEAARKQVRYEDFLPENPTKKDVEYAKWLYNYIFNTKNADYEFLAKALTVPELSVALKKVNVQRENNKESLLSTIYHYFGVIMDFLRGETDPDVRGKDAHSLMLSLSYQLGKINKQAAEKSLGLTRSDPQAGLLVRMLDIVNNIDGTTAAKLERLKAGMGSRAEKDIDPKMPEGLIDRAVWLSKFFYLSLVNPTYTKVVGSLVTAMGLPPESTLREIVSGLFEKDSLQLAAEGLGMISSYIDKKRNNEVNIVKQQVLSFFKDTPSKEQEEALTAVFMDTDLAGLVGKKSATDNISGRLFTYSKTTISKLLSDDAYLDQRMRFLRKALKAEDNENYQWNSTQSYLLGSYMATGRVTTETNFNAENIAKGFLGDNIRQPNELVIKLVDELATLEAVKQTPKTDKDIVLDVIAKDWSAVDRVTEVIAGFKKNSDAIGFSEGKAHKVKGYSRQVYDDSIVVEVAPLKDRADMEKQGFTLKSVLVPVEGETRALQMALYVTSSAGRVDRLRGAARFNTVKTKGTSLKDINYKEGELFTSDTIHMRTKRDILRIEHSAAKRVKAIKAGKHDVKNSVWGLAPVVDDRGNAVDYRYMMDKNTKKGLLKQDTRISEVLGKSFGSLVDKDLSKEHNKKVADLVLSDMEENWVQGDRGKDGLTPYVEIGPDVSDKEMRKLFFMLPESFREEALKSDQGVLAVRRDLIHILFGYTNLTTTDFPGLKKITPKVLNKALAFAESIWVDAVKLVKGNILLKTPAVISSNILSNLLYSAMRGYNPAQVLAMYADSYKDIKLYSKNEREVQEIDNNLRFLAERSEKVTTTEKEKKEAALEFEKLTQKRKALIRRNAESPIHELILLGLDQNAEDSANDVGDSSNSIVRALEEQVNKAPEFVQTATDILFITRRTSFYKVANDFLETSDLVARDVQNRLEKKVIEKQANGQAVLPLWWLEDKKEGYAVKQALKGKEKEEFLDRASKQRVADLVEDYVNYAKPSGRFEEYLNRVGILMFTKYVKRIQRIILKNSTSAPLKSLASVMGLSYAADLPTIHEQSFLAKEWYTDSIGPGNVFPIYGPIDIMANLLTPPALKFVPY